MPLKLIRQDITKIECDAVVAPSNRYLEPGGGADMAIREAAGPELDEYCARLGGCEIGKAKISPAFRLPCKYVIHTAGPNWLRLHNAAELLRSCYRECLSLAAENGCESIAFPLIGAGTYGCPRNIVLKTATEIIGDFLLEHEMLVYLVVYDKESYDISRRIYSDISAFIDDNYVSDHSEYCVADACEESSVTSLRRPELIRKRKQRLSEIGNKSCGVARREEPVAEDEDIDSLFYSQVELDDLIKNMDKGFAETLFHFIDEKGMTDVECYKRSNVDKKTFSKIKCVKDYKPSKKTAVSFAIGLKLDLEETQALLASAGFCLANNDLFDVIIKYFVISGNYGNIFDVNEVLYKFDQQLLGV